MKRRIFRMMMLCLTAVLLLGLSSCGKSEEDPKTVLGSMPEYQVEQLSECVELESYVGLTVSLTDASQHKSDAVWEKILATAQIRSYPEEQVNYYTAQTKAKYRYTAKQNDMTYEELLETLGVTEEDILRESKEMVKGDLVYRYIVQDAGIVLTDTEKSTLFDRYADKFVADEGIKENLVKEFNADVCDMECAAVLLTSLTANVPALIIKAVSDGKGGAEEFTRRVNKASEAYLDTLKNIIERI